jgi:hypothetical protein
MANKHRVLFCRSRTQIQDVNDSTALSEEIFEMSDAVIVDWQANARKLRIRFRVWLLVVDDREAGRTVVFERIHK